MRACISLQAEAEEREAHSQPLETVEALSEEPEYHHGPEAGGAHREEASPAPVAAAGAAEDSDMVETVILFPMMITPTI